MYSSVYIYTYMIVCNYIYIFVYVYIYIYNVICLSFICMDVFHRNQTNNSIYIHLYTHYKHVFSELPPEAASAISSSPDLDIIYV